MENYYKLVHPWLFVALLSGVVLLFLYRMLKHSGIVYRHSLIKVLFERGYTKGGYVKFFFNFIRFLFLAALAFVLARPQRIDTFNKVQVDGIDIMMVLDVSGSMMCYDNFQDKRMRIDVAKQEAINFVMKRENDPIGLVLFGNKAVARCPLTLDKKTLHDIIEDIQLGVIDPDGTVLATGIAMGVNRLIKSEAKSKIMIVLTDGTPTQNDMDVQESLELAKKFGIKIYTIGIGDQDGGFIDHPMFGTQRMPFSINTRLLQAIAQYTGGRFFLAQQPDDLQRIYNIIDQLERTEYDAPVFTRSFEMYQPFLAGALAVLLLELFFSTAVWFII